MSRNHRAFDRRLWTLARRLCFKLADGRCAVCGARASVVDHKVRLADGGQPFAQSNLQALCRYCSISKTARANRPLGKRGGDWLAFAREVSRVAD